MLYDVCLCLFILEESIMALETHRSVSAKAYENTPDDMRSTMFQCEHCRKWFSDAEIFDQHACVRMDANKGNK